MADLQRLGPFGQANPAPCFIATDVDVCGMKTVGGRHRQMTLRIPGGTHTLPAIQFNTAVGSEPARRFEKVAYRPQWNYWNGRKRLQLMIENTQPAS